MAEITTVNWEMVRRRTEIHRLKLWLLEWLVYPDLASLGSANVAPVITQGAGPLTKTVVEDGMASWTTSELDATDVDTARPDH